MLAIPFRCVKFGENRLILVAGQGFSLSSLFFLMLFFVMSAGRTAQPIFMLNGTNDELWPKEVHAFGGLIEKMDFV
jgi:hypothetical protein